MKAPLHILALAATFIAGAVIHAVWSRNPTEVGTRQKEYAVRPLVPELGTATQSARDQSIQQSAKRSETEDPRSLSLRLEVVDAILSGGDLNRKLSRMGLAEGQVQAVSTIRRNAIAALKRIEREHARTVSDDRGDYVAIDAFPVERSKWLELIEANLRELLGDDRAAIVARMIAFADNDEDVGIYRRELFITEPQKDGNKLRIEERTFNAEGQHIDSDYELVDSQSQSRWGHLLDLGNK